ncbi:hypothetical protein FORC065_3146 [Yersinia enterocolitica]|nr:hypothetical protein FORC065_3146 [Yersinia enterocolitica]
MYLTRSFTQDTGYNGYLTHLFPKSLALWQASENCCNIKEERDF